MNRTSEDTGAVTTGAGPHPDASSVGPDPSSERPRTRRKPSTRVVRGSAVVGVTVLASLALLQPASADTRRFSDPNGDTGLPADITTVRVTNGSERVKVKARPGRVEFEDFFTYWLDTRPKNPGPEYRVDVVPNSDAFGLTRVDAFGEQGTPVPCDGLRATADNSNPEWISISVPRSCLENPGKVRVAVKARYTDGDTSVVDWAPAKRKFFGWVAR
jgi:hypothetical protein